MNLPIDKSSPGGLLLAAVFGLVFGVLLQKGRVANYNVIVNQFRLKDWTMLKVMFSAVVTGAIGVFAMMQAGWLTGYHIKAATVLPVALGAAIFGVGMVLYGFCPGTGVAALATGRLDALVGFGGMLAGGIAYAYSHSWLNAHVLNVGELGKVRLSDVTGVPDSVWLLALVAIAGAIFYLLQRFGPKPEPAAA